MQSNAPSSQQPAASEQPSAATQPDHAASSDPSRAVGTSQAEPADGSEPLPGSKQPAASLPAEEDDQDTRALNGNLIQRLRELNIPSAEKIAFEVVRLLRLGPTGDPVLKESAKVVKQIEAAIDIHELVNVASLDHFRDEQGEDFIICPYCFDVEHPEGRLGKFSARQPLKTLKKTVKSHFGGDLHSMRLRQQHENIKMMQRSKKTGMILARLALQTLREAGSYQGFESKVLDAHLNGLDVGTIGHSRAFCRDMTQSFDRVTVARMKRFLHAVDPVCALCP